MYKMQITGQRPPEHQNGSLPWYRVFVALVARFPCSCQGYSPSTRRKLDSEEQDIGGQM